MKTSMKRTPEARVVSQLSRRKTSFAARAHLRRSERPFLKNPSLARKSDHCSVMYEGVEYHTVRGDLTLMRAEGEFNALVEDLVKALDKFNVKEKEKNELLGKLAPLKSDIVEVKSQQTGTPLPANFKPAPPLKEGKTKGDKEKKDEKKKKGY
jgi:hemoglobin